MTVAPMKVLFFSPYAGIWQHAMPEALVAAELQRSGADITYITCDGILSAGCGAMAAAGVSYTADMVTRQGICANCRQQRNLIVDSIRVETVSMDALIDSATLALIDQSVESITTHSMLEFSVEGFPLGRYALHDTIIRFKLTDLIEVTPAAFEHFKVSLKHVLMAFYVAKQALAKYKPDRIVTYNTQHSINYAFMNLAERNGIAVFGLHASGNMAKRLTGLYVFRRDMVVLYREMIRLFEEKLRHIPSDVAGIRDATDHYLALTSGRMIFVYSAPKHAKRFDVRSFFGVKPQQKVLLATLSSYDELFSSQTMGVMKTYPLIFPSQIEWIGELIGWVKNRPDLFLIIRVHPREFPNRRDPLHSSHARALAETFENLPSNVKINWPTDNISLYDLAVETDVGLNGWSSAGKELAFLGIPVVLFASEILYYPASLNLLAKDKNNYFTRIDEALIEGWSIERIRLTYRWLALEYTLATIDISDGFDFQEVRAPFLRRIFNRLKRLIDPLHIQRAHVHALRRPLKQGSKIVRAILEEIPVFTLQLQDRRSLSEIEEERLLRAEIGRIVEQVYVDQSHLNSPLIGHLHKAVLTND
ncbi:MAG: hypothetical protein HY067_17265 [Betaproteobacteria bacterium]|nr:hypothetical protein [Betaproteobacteria bacterium]